MNRRVVACARNPASAATLMALLLSACALGAQSASPTLVLTASPSTPPAQESPRPTTATLVPEGTAAPTTRERFSVAQSFGDEGWNTQILDIAYWDRRFIAISASTAIMTDARENKVWLSDDGDKWTSQPLRLPGESPRPSWLVSLGGGRLAILGTVLETTDTPGTLAPRVWESSDLSHWDLSHLGIPEESAFPHAVAQGPRGYVAAVGSTLWYSVDGVSWEFADSRSAGSVHAGGEGFVAIGSAGPNLARIDASGDGARWYSGDSLPEWGLSVSAVGAGEWIAVAGSEEFEIFTSDNGLDWHQSTSIRQLSALSSGVGIDTQVTDVPLVTIGKQVFMTLAWNHCCAQLSGGRGVWTSTNGAEWRRLPDFDGAVVVAGATDGDTIVLGGFVHRGGEGVLWVSGAP